MNINKIQINPFKLADMINHPSILIVGNRGTGRSHIARDIMHNYQHTPAGMVISPTERMNSFYKNFCPDLFIHYNMDKTLIEKLLIRQNKMIDITKNEADKLIDPSILLIMDDCLKGDKEWTNDENLIKILNNGKDYYLTTVLICHSLTAPDLELDFDYIFLLKEEYEPNKKILWENFGSIFPTFESFEKVFDACTNNYSAMVIDNRTSTINIQDKVFWFKSKECNFSFGSEKFKQLHQKYYDPSEKQISSTIN